MNSTRKCKLTTCVQYIVVNGVRLDVWSQTIKLPFGLQGVPDLCLELLGKVLVSEHLHKLEEDGSFLFDGETLCDLVLNVGGEGVVGG